MSSCYAGILSLNNAGCKLFDIGLHRNATTVFRQAMESLKKSCTDQYICLEEIVAQLNQAMVPLEAASIHATPASTEVVELCMSCMDFGNSLKILEYSDDSKPIRLSSHDDFLPDTIETEIISAVLLHNMGVGLLSIARTCEDVQTPPLRHLLTSIRSILKHSESIIESNAFSKSNGDFQAPMVELVHAMIISKLYAIEHEFEDGDVSGSSICCYKEKMEYAKRRVKMSISSTISTWGSLLTIQTASAA